MTVDDGVLGFTVVVPGLTAVGVVPDLTGVVRLFGVVAAGFVVVDFGLGFDERSVVPPIMPPRSCCALAMVVSTKTIAAAQTNRLRDEIGMTFLLLRDRMEAGETPAW